MAKQSRIAQAAAAAILFGLAGTALADHRQVVGYIEDVRIFPGDIPFRAKLDTGARTSSIDVRNLGTFKKGDKDWVRFTIVNRHDQDVTLERPVVRVSRVNRAGAEQEVRYVVRLGICLGDYLKTAEINLNDRSSMRYRLLIGRLFLADHFFVNSSARLLTAPVCDVDVEEGQ